MNIFKTIGFLVISLSPTIAMAVLPTFTEVSTNTMGPLTLAGRAIYGICYVAGAGFLLGGVLQYKYHRENPQQVRISTPIMLIAVGIVLCLLPYLTSQSQSGSFLHE